MSEEYLKELVEKYFKTYKELYELQCKINKGCETSYFPDLEKSGDDFYLPALEGNYDLLCCKDGMIKFLATMFGKNIVEEYRPLSYYTKLKKIDLFGLEVYTFGS